MRRRLRRLALLALCWSAMTGAVFSGCKGLFTPAVPEPPSGNPIQVNYRTPEATLRTIEEGINAKARGASAYLGAFADSTSPDTPGYHQTFDPAVLALWQQSSGHQAPSDWSFSLEQNFYLKFVQIRPGDEYAATFDSVETNPDPQPGDTQVIVHRHYTVVANSPDGNTSTVIAIGFADLTFSLSVAGQWLITRWDDHVDPNVGLNPVDQDQLTMGRRRLDSQ